MSPYHQFFQLTRSSVFIIINLDQEKNFSSNDKAIECTQPDDSKSDTLNYNSIQFRFVSFCIHDLP